MKLKKISNIRYYIKKGGQYSKSLMQNLFSNYDSTLIPGMKPNQSLSISLGFGISQLIENVSSYIILFLLLLQKKYFYFHIRMMLPRL